LSLACKLRSASVFSFLLPSTHPSQRRLFPSLCPFHLFVAPSTAYHLRSESYNKHFSHPAVLAASQNRSLRPFFLLAILDGRNRHRSHQHHRRRSKTLDSQPSSPTADKLVISLGASSPAVNSRDLDRLPAGGAAHKQEKQQHHQDPPAASNPTTSMAARSKTPSPPPTKASLKAWWKQFTFVQKVKKGPEVQKGASLSISAFFPAFSYANNHRTSADEHDVHPVFGVPLRESLRYARVQISTADTNGELYVWGYIPIVVAKWYARATPFCFLLDQSRTHANIFSIPRVLPTQRTVSEGKWFVCHMDRLGFQWIWGC
jgi:hypothetical protein